VPEFEIVEMDGPFILRWKNPPELSSDELLEFSEINDVLDLERECDGSLLIMSPLTLKTAREETEILFQLATWARQDGTGEALHSRGSYYLPNQLPNQAMREPDVAWIRRDRIEALPEQELQTIPHLVPDCVVEVRSKSNSLRRLQDKMQEYTANGVRLGWLLDGDTRTAYVYRPDAEVQVLEQPTALDGSPELPGFTLDLTRVWR
jgi:Uma2 family endonuclease